MTKKGKRQKNNIFYDIKKTTTAIQIKKEKKKNL